MPQPKPELKRYGLVCDLQSARNLNVVCQGNTIFQNVSYSYDKVGNVLGLKNDMVLPRANEYGGPSCSEVLMKGVRGGVEVLQ